MQRGRGGCGADQGGSVRRGSRAAEQWLEGSREHEDLGLHEGQVRQGGDDLGRLLAQVLLLLGLPVETPTGGDTHYGSH